MNAWKFCKQQVPIRHVNAKPAKTPCNIQPKKSVNASLSHWIPDDFMPVKIDDAVEFIYFHLTELIKNLLSNLFKIQLSI